MSQNRMNKALKLALAATQEDPDDRYKAAMIRRALAILSRAQKHSDPAEELPQNPTDLARAIRHRKGDPTSILELQNYVTAKLEISNPDYLQNT